MVPPFAPSSPFLPPFLLAMRDSLSVAFPIYARSCLFTSAPWNTALSLPPPACSGSLLVPRVSQIYIIYMTNVADRRRIACIACIACTLDPSEGYLR